MFTFVDLILIVLVLAFVMAGFFFGLIQVVGSLAGIIAGAWLAGSYYQLVGEWITPLVLGNEELAKIIAFIAIFIVVNRLAALIFYIINKAFRLVAIIPFLGTINRLGGAILGLAEGVLIVGLLVYVVAKLAVNFDFIIYHLDGSRVAHGLVWLTGWISVFLPEKIDQMVSIFN